MVEELAVRMAALGHQVVAYNRKGHNVAGSEFDNESNSSGASYRYRGVTVIPVATIEGKGLAALTSSFAATLKALRSRPDVIHYHAEGPCVPLLLAHWAGIRTVATIHGLDWQRAKWGRFASMYLKLGERIAARYADEVIVLSRNVQQYFLETYGREVHFIPNGIDRREPVEADVITRTYGLVKDGYILFLGRMVPEKGVHYLVEAFRRLDTDKKLVIAGGASDSAEYYDRIRSMAEGDPRIILTGFVQGQVLEELYSNAYLYVLPSDLEGMPMSLLEAMSYGNCCITSDIPECAEVIGNYGVTFRKSDVLELADKLSELLLNSDQRQHFRSQAVDYITNSFSWKSVVDQTLTLYKRVEDSHTSDQE